MKEIAGIEHALATLKPYWGEVENHFEARNNEFLALANSDPDPIGRVLKCHLMVEHFMDQFLVQHYRISDYSKIKLRFIQKALMLPKTDSSAAFVRPGILQLNVVRNSFGHELSCEIRGEQVSSIYEILRYARPDVEFKDHVPAIEAFAPVACAFLTVPIPELDAVFADAFKGLRSDTPYGCEDE